MMRKRRVMSKATEGHSVTLTDGFPAGMCRLNSGAGIALPC